MSKKTSPSTFYCLKCATSITLPRIMARMREKGHLKKIYCVGCQKEMNHLEVREFDMDFDKEEFFQRVENGEFLHICEEGAEE